jgi:hypothetical protein
MRSASGTRGRLGLACLVASLATVALAGTASAAPSGTVTISGTSVGVLELTLTDASADFGAALAPDGSGAGGEVGGSFTGAAGACFSWAGTASVRSNVSYRVTVNGSGSLPRLGFLTAAPATYAACSGGEAASTNMFPGNTPIHAFVTSTQAVTTGRNHNFWLGMSVGWTDAPGNLNPAPAVSLTITATQYP